VYEHRGNGRRYSKPCPFVTFLEISEKHVKFNRGVLVTWKYSLCLLRIPSIDNQIIAARIENLTLNEASEYFQGTAEVVLRIGNVIWIAFVTLYLKLEMGM
jgi:hypothetical protein